MGIDLTAFFFPLHNEELHSFFYSVRNSFNHETHWLMLLGVLLLLNVPYYRTSALAFFRSTKGISANITTLWRQISQYDFSNLFSRVQEGNFQQIRHNSLHLVLHELKRLYIISLHQF